MRPALRAVSLPAAAVILLGMAVASPWKMPPAAPPATVVASSAPSTARPRTGAARQADPNVPVRLMIPALHIDAPVLSVGLSPDGAMQEPPSPGTAAWFAPGTRPGEPGNAVIAGHLDSATGAALFWHIKELHQGDLVVVADASGTARSFTVDRVEQVATDAAPMDRIFGPATTQNLNLITCGGTWDRAQNRYRDRLIVFTRALHLPAGLKIFPETYEGT